MKAPLIAAAVVEIATGLALVLAPALVGRLLLGSELTGVAVPVAHVLGIAFIALGVACWPGTPLCGMLTYNAAVTLYLGYLDSRAGSSAHFSGRRRGWAPDLDALLGRVLINKRKAS